MTDLVLVRHGETVWHHDNRYTGRTDVSLTERGRQQANLLAHWATHAGLTAMWASPLSRAQDTAKAVTSAIGLRATVDDRLTELDFGEGEGLTGQEMAARFPEARQAFQADPVAFHLPGGEDPVRAAERAERCLADVVAAAPEGRVLVVGHSTLHRLVLCRLLGLPLSTYRTVFPVVRNCAITTVRWTGTGRAALIEFNTRIEETR
ncbi:histidine phosphatase family protein [Prauserella sp. PE36]|uniref:Histidine phosphatase family protein n=1 Tax=Prauserella endophytica TaxID=1592324 RepID=A0ABY2RYN4_9PSEU|nr:MULTISPECIES: histidine phosphatase family protein [Prauserella]PXY33489.1 phosphoglycerate mutase [Prauserella coralliicola]RBM21692.1 histidine phosphatase family protein [Prauserella sp. PE36]TKG65798.1 histidine phosphatase family protein [Prauserella endophytica]